MRSLLPLAVLISLAFIMAPASGLSADSPDTEKLDEYIALATPEIPNPVGHNVDVWLPAFQDGGYIAAVRAILLDNHEFTHEPGTPEVLHFLMAIGDADNDRRDDVAVIEFDLEDEEITITALSGARESKVIWEMEVDFDEATFPIGDVNNDDVLDFVRMEESDGQYNYDEFEFTIEFDILDGRDLEVMLTSSMEGRGSYTFESSNPTNILIGSQSRHFEADLPFLMDRWDEDGYAILTMHVSEDQNSEGVVIATKQSYDWTFGTTLSQYDLEKQLSLTVGGPDMLWWGLLDGNADGTTDLLFAEGPGHYYFEYSATDLYPILPREEPESPSVVLQLFDGATAESLWRTDSGLRSDELILISTLGDLYGPGGSIGVASLGFEVTQDVMSYDYRIYSNIVLIEGATGEIKLAEQENEDRILLPLRLGDADGDDLDELLLLDFGFYGSSKLRATEADLTDLWSISLNDGVWVTELDGDDVVDVLVIEDDDEIEAHTGTTGDEIWQVEIDDMRGFDTTHDIDLDGGADLALLVIEDMGADLSDANMLLLSGASGETIWTKQIYTASEFEDVVADYADINVGSLGDVDNDGATDLQIYVYGYTESEFYCDASGCWEEPSETEGNMLFITAALDAADGHTFLRYDAMPHADGVEHAEDLPIDQGPAGRVMDSRLDKGIPGPGLVLLLAGVIGLVAVARRKM